MARWPSSCAKRMARWPCCGRWLLASSSGRSCKKGEPDLDILMGSCGRSRALRHILAFYSSSTLKGFNGPSVRPLYRSKALRASRHWRNPRACKSCCFVRRRRTFNSQPAPGYAFQRQPKVWTVTMTRSSNDDAHDEHDEMAEKTTFDEQKPTMKHIYMLGFVTAPVTLHQLTDF